MAVITYREAVRRTLQEEMERDERIFLIGEDIGAFFDDHHLRTGQRETAGDRATDHTGADDGDIKFRGGGFSHGLPFAFVFQSEISRRDGSRRCSSSVHKRE